MVFIDPQGKETRTIQGVTRQKLVICEHRSPVIDADGHAWMCVHGQMQVHGGGGGEEGGGLGGVRVHTCTSCSSI